MLGIPIESRDHVFHVFDLSSGKRLQQFAWKQDAEVACYNNGQFIFLSMQFNGINGSHEAILRADSKQPEAPKAWPAIPTFQIRRLVECGPGAERFPLLNDEAEASYCLDNRVIITEEDVASAFGYTDGVGQHEFSMQFTDEGAKKLRAATSGPSTEHEVLGIMIDGELVLTATVIEPLGRDLVLTGGKFPMGDLAEWISQLNRMIEKRKNTRGI
jgi:hypothetical protein